VFSSVWVAAAAAALVAASSRSIGTAIDPFTVGLAFCGTLVVYNVDRLRDIARDSHTAPHRTRFVKSHEGSLRTLTALGAATAFVLAVGAGREVIVLLLPVLAAGLLHRRLKRFAFAKPVYVTCAWLAVVVGLPWTRSPHAEHVGWTLTVLGAAVLANAIASNVRDQEAGAARIGARAALGVARGLAGVAVILALAAPAPVRILTPVPVATLLVLLAFQQEERYGLVVVDGALMAGAALALWV